MSAPSFAMYPRRIVVAPNGSSVLLLIRRNTAHKFNWLNNLDWRWELERVHRLLRHDRTWRVEAYLEMSVDPLSVPRRDADLVWIAPTKLAAAELAERVAGRFRARGEMQRASRE